MRNLTLITLILLLFSCNSQRSVAGHTGIESIHGDWVAEEIQGVDQQVLESIEEEERPSLEIRLSEKKYGGSDGCNRYFGSITEAKGSSLRFGQAAGTMMACPDMELPQSFLDALERVHS
jgi:heat shock protein HslJ